MRRKIGIFSICLLVSASFWLLTSLSREHTTSVSVPVKFTGIPAHLAATGDIPASITLKIRSRGFNILSQNVSKSWGTIELPIQLPPDVITGNKAEYTFFPSRMQDMIRSQMQAGMEIMDIDPDSVVFHFESFASRKVPVRLPQTIRFARMYGFSAAPSLYPDSIVISGPGDVLDKIPEVFLMPPDVEISGNYNNDLAPALPPDVRSTPEKIKVKFSVSMLTEKRLDVPVTMINLPDTLSVTISPTMCEVVLLVPVAEEHTVDADDVLIVADFAEWQQSALRKIILSVETLPYYKVVRHEPSSVNYVIKQKSGL